MYAETYPFVARPLPYDYDALMPVLDEETLHFHHDKHYQNYVNQLNHILADYPELQKKTLPELLMDTKKLPETARQALQAALDDWNREQDAQAAGELLFAAANAMRLAGVDAEEALTFASKRYCAELLAQKEQSGTQVE